MKEPVVESSKLGNTSGMYLCPSQCPKYFSSSPFFGFSLGTYGTSKDENRCIHSVSRDNRVL